jgi:hypothetical protein
VIRAVSTGSSIVSTTAAAWPRSSLSTSSRRATSPNSTSIPRLARGEHRIDVAVDREIGARLCSSSMSATICPTRPKPKITVARGRPPRAEFLARAPVDPPRGPAAGRASSGVTVRPSAVTACQNAAASRSMTPATAPAPSRISVVSDGLAISRPVSAATCPCAARQPQQRRGDERLDDQHADQREQQRRPVGEQRAKVELHPDGDQEHAQRQPAQRRGDQFDFAAIFGLGDQHAGDQRAEDRATGRPRWWQGWRGSRPAG